MQTISQLGSDDNTAPAVALSSLETALVLAQDQATIHHLANPAVISGCIRLIQAAINQSPGVISLFSHEYGYLCFRLLSVALDTCLLREWGLIHKLRRTCDLCHSLSPRFVASTELGLALADNLNKLESKADS
ncbi:unnamed protein product, partial [Rhizoctonia solani]